MNEIKPMEPGFRRTMLLVTMLFVAIMAALDLTIVAVALPYMAGGLSATPDEITWVVTMFSIGQALVIGITGHLSRLLGRKRLALISVVGFVLSSAACGLSEDLDMIVMFRFIQGLFSGPLIPLSQAALVDAFPTEQRTRVLAMWAMGVTAGPALGPAIGGMLTQFLDWRWNFWVNFPIGVVALVLVTIFMRPVQAKDVRTDWLGLGLLAAFMVCLQVGLNQGDRLSWFSSHEITVLFTISGIAFLTFVLRGMELGEKNIINLNLLRDINFVACSLTMGIGGLSFLAFMVLAPAVYVDQFGWEIVTAGYVVGVSAAALIVASQVANPLSKLVGKRLTVCIGIVITATGWFLFSRLNLNTSPEQAILPGAFICFGLMVIFPVIAAQAFSGIAPDQRDEAAGLFNLIKTIGFALGVTFVTTWIYRGNQQNWSQMAGLLEPTRPGYSVYLQAAGVDDQTPQAGALLFEVLWAQSQMLTYNQTMEVVAIVVLCSLPFTLFMRSPARSH